MSEIFAFVVLAFCERGTAREGGGMRDMSIRDRLLVIIKKSKEAKKITLCSFSFEILQEKYEILSMNDLHLPPISTTTATATATTAAAAAAVPFFELSDEFPLADLKLGANLVEAMGAVQKRRQGVGFFFLRFRLLPLMLMLL